MLGTCYKIIVSFTKRKQREYFLKMFAAVDGLRLLATSMISFCKRYFFVVDETFWHHFL